MPQPPQITPAYCSDYALCNALGNNRQQVLECLRHGQSGLAKPSMPLAFETQVGQVVGALPSLPDAFFSYESRIARMAFMLSEQMRSSIAKATQRWGAERVAVILATSTGGLFETEAVHKASLQGKAPPLGYGLLRTHSLSASAELLSQAYGLQGPSYVISTACSSSAKALASAQRLIHTGVADAVVAGGIDTLCFLTLSGFASLGILSSLACRPFAKDRTGINIGEGGALLLLERKAEGAVALLGSGETSDAHHMSAPDPQGLGAQSAMQAALSQARVTTAEVGYINAHGTGTPLNDAAESMAIARLFGQAPTVVSTKGYTGHMLGAAGATEAAFCVLALEQGFTPESLGSSPPEEGLGIRIGHGKEALHSRYALSNSFAFGGSNISLLFGGGIHA
jgi:3-oxoacyl-[acyl-carrier-protein] synthase I